MASDTVDVHPKDHKTSTVPNEPTGAPTAGEFFCIELFAGSAGLTFAMKHYFKQSFGIDHKSGQAKARVVCLDLTIKENQKLVMEWALLPECLWVHSGVPCGTASKARQIRLSKKKHGPPPLRSHKWPLGLPGLSGAALAKVRSANILYSFSCDLILQLDKAGKVWTLENPWSSLLWHTPYWKNVERKLRPFMVELDYCMFGGRRKKHTCLATNSCALTALNLLCDGQHDHDPWTFSDGKFSTAEEAAYTPAFCKAVASTVFESLSEKFNLGDAFEINKRLKLSSFPGIASGVQPNKQIPPVVSEFAVIITVQQCDAHNLNLDSKQCLKKCLHIKHACAPFVIPTGARLLRQARSPEGGSDTSCLRQVTMKASKQLSNFSGSYVSDCNDQSTIFHLVDCLSLKCHCESMCESVLGFSKTGDQLVFGVRWTPEAFVEQAVSVGHPMNIFSGLSSEVCDAITDISSMHPAQIILRRKRWLHRWICEAKSLELQDAKMKSGATPERLKILQPKRLALLKSIILDEHYPDEMLADDVARGFDLVGKIPASGTLPQKFSPSSLTIADLHSAAPSARKALKMMTRSCGDHNMDLQLWEKTQVELEKGWIVGPFDWDTLPSTAVVSRRFPIEQGGKVRPIDDYTQSQVNLTIHSTETASVDNVDYICAMFSRLIGELRENGRECEILSRSLDLSSAYRQLSISSDSADYSYISVYDPRNDRAALYRQVALPFGSKAAVNAFIRCSRCLQWIASKCLAIPLSCYFDDFVLASPPSLSENTDASMRVMLSLLGWQFDESGPKADTFSLDVAALGVVFSLTETPRGIFEVRNTDRRISEVCAMLDDILESGTLTLKQAQVARGRLAFCDAYVFGRSGKSALQEITKHGFAKPFKLHINCRLRAKLGNLKARMEAAKPRLISTDISVSWSLFSDASFSPEDGSGLGAVLIDHNGTCVAWFSLHLTIDEISFLDTGTNQTVIGELETIVVALALKVWMPLLTSRHVVFFVDNEGAKFSLIRGYSSSQAITCICEVTAQLIDDCVLIPWFTRVASPSNIADPPSRQQSHPWLLPSLQVHSDFIKSSFLDLAHSVMSRLKEAT